MGRSWRKGEKKREVKCDLSGGYWRRGRGEDAEEDGEDLEDEERREGRGG